MKANMNGFYARCWRNDARQASKYHFDCLLSSDTEVNMFTIGVADLPGLTASTELR